VYRIESQVDTRSAEFRENRERNQKAIDAFRERLSKVREGGPPHMHEKHGARGKLFARERVRRLLDPGTPFLELSALAANGMYDDEAPSAGVVTGIGVVHGREVMVIANDATVKGGTYYPITIKKHLRAQDVAMENRLPTIYMTDSGGVFLPRQDGVFPDRFHFGRLFANQARMSAAGIPQICAVMGFCTAGGAYQPAMSDETVQVKGVGTIYIGGPPLVKAATGEVVTAEELGGADVHCRESGVSDHLAQDDAHGLQLVRNIVENLEPARRHPADVHEPEDPHYDPAELLGVMPHDLRKPVEAREVIARIVDGSRFHEFKELYGRTLVTGFARILGQPVGILANNGVLFRESSQKGAHFIELCCQRKIPLLFLQNITGFMIGREYEAGGIARDGAKLVHATANAQVPRFTLIFGASHGAGNYAMCGRGYDPRLLFSWPTSKISVMGGEEAARTLLQVRMDALEAKGKPAMTPEEQEEFKRPILEKYEREGSAYYATARLWDDGIIEPEDTRTTLGLSIAASLNAPIPDHHFGVFRM
jgi:3-methylcrotonyl-CoA carboxylase beta subunit